MKKSQEESVECLSLRELLLKFRKLLWVVLLPIWGGVLYILPEVLNKLLTPKQLASALSVCLIICLTLIVWVAYLLIQSSNQLTCRFGLYWDKRKNPYCPTCKTPLLISQYWNFGSVTAPSLLCSKCGSHLPMTDETGKCYDLPSIKRLL